MAVMVLDVPTPEWNNVVFQSAMLGLDISPDDHREKGNTVVEITGTWEKLNQVFARIKAREIRAFTELLAVMESKPLDALG
jgi:ribosome biogenesis protein Tsr3